jgi:NADH-quinone oxidoreductase subunit N
MNWHTASAEFALSILILGLMVFDTFNRSNSKGNFWKISATGLAIIGIVLFFERNWVGESPSYGFRLDSFAYLFKWLFLIIVAFVIFMSRIFTNKLKANIAEWHMLILSSLLGMFVLASARDLLLVFIGLELLTFSLYVMAAYLKTDKRSIEAGMKYLIMGSISSGIFVFGISLLYGASGGIGFEALSVVFNPPGPSILAKTGMMMVLCGLGFKIAAFPFHFWAPDVYEGAPTPVVALMSVGSKMAGIMIMLRLLHEVFLPAKYIWSIVLAVISALTMCYGNLAAIPQTNIKRLLGYSSIGQAGYLLMGIASTNQIGMEAVVFYLLAYLFGNMAVFFGVTIAEQDSGSSELDSFNGLSKRSSLLAASMFVGLLSLAGVPPLAGFIGKLFVLISSAQRGFLWLVAIGAINVAISLYYYLMIVRRMYTKQPASDGPIKVDATSKTALLILVIGTVVIGIFQAPFLSVISKALIGLPR